MRYEIEGAPLSVLTCHLSKGEVMVCQSGAMSWMHNLSMSTEMKGGLGKAFGRSFSGESMFLNYYTCQGEDGFIAFSSSMPGNIIAMRMEEVGCIVAQKRAFLASEPTVETEAKFSGIKKGLFGGEGFIMQRVSGRGLVFFELDGHIQEINLAPGQTLQVDTGHIALMEDTVNMDIERIKGVKNVLFGGEGLFNTTVTGPGKVWLQSMPVSKLAGSVAPFIASGD